MTFKEHVDDIRDRLEKGEFIGEAAVVYGIVLRLLDALTWPRFNPQIIILEYSIEGRRVDLALCHPPSKPIIFIEVKKVGSIEGAERQLFEYAFHAGVPIAILTDGQKWQFFHPSGQGDYRERKVREVDLIQDESEESAKCLNRYLNYESIRTGEAVEAIKADYGKVVQQRQVATRLPDAWRKLLEEADEFLLHAVAEKTESLCGYRPTDEQVLSFLRSLKPEREIEPPPKREDLTRNPGLFVTMPDGKIINHSVSATTFVEVIEKLGIERVRNLERRELGIPFIDTTPHSRYSQHKSEQYYILTNNSTEKKQRNLKEIASALGVQLQVEIVDK